MLEGIVFVVVVVVVVYISIQYYARQEREEYYRRKITANSLEYINLVGNYNKSVKQGKPIMSKIEFERKKKEIINSHTSRLKIDRAVEDEQNRAQLSAEKYAKERAAYLNENLEENTKKRKFGNNFDEVIFKIFNDRWELTKDELLDGIDESRDLPFVYKEGQQYYISEMFLSSEKILNLWIENSLIKKLYLGKNRDEIYYTVGYILTEMEYKINSSDKVWPLWVGARKITLKHCKAYEEMDARRDDFEDDDYLL